VRLDRIARIGQDFMRSVHLPDTGKTTVSRRIRVPPATRPDIVKRQT
jgi:hypothetical protein